MNTVKIAWDLLCTVKQLYESLYSFEMKSKLIEGKEGKQAGKHIIHICFQAFSNCRLDEGADPLQTFEL